MSVDAAKKVLLFITHEPDSLKSVVTFLKKRGFDVHIESEIKESIVRVFEIKPDFIFLAWDHTDAKAQSLPKAFAQSTASIIVPYINKSTKDAIFKIDRCPYSPKIYPPISGPSVERVMLKTKKDDADYLEKVNKFKNSEIKAEAVIALQDKLTETTDNDIDFSSDQPPPDSGTQVFSGTKQSPRFPDNFSKEKANEVQTKLDQRNGLLDEEKVSLNDEQKNNLSESLKDTVIPSLENILSSQQLAPEEDTNSSNPDFNRSEFKNSPYSDADSQKPSSLVFQKSPDSTFKYDGPMIQKGAKGEAFVFNPQEISARQQSLLDVETSVEVNTYKVYCISIVCASWCGYFVVSSLTTLDFLTIDLVFSDWIKSQMRNLDDISERDYFDFEGVSEDIINEVQRLADYSEQMTAHDQQFSVSFFAVEPKDMKIDFSTDKNYIQVYTRDIPPEAALDFDLVLHLPENQKYLLFTLKDMALTDEQRSRLLNRNVTSLFTGLENEYEFRRFLVRKTFTRLHKIINSKLSDS